MRNPNDPKIEQARQAGELWSGIFREHAETTRRLPVTPLAERADARPYRSWFQEIGAGQYDKPPETVTDSGTERPRKIRRANDEPSFFGDRKPI